MATRNILIPVPDRDFDTTEVSVPWRLLTRAGHRVTFATEKGGAAPACDPLLLTGVVFGKLGAEPEARAFYEELTRSPEFKAPIAWDAIKPDEYDALLLPGGHAPGMTQYLGSEPLRKKVREFWLLGRPTAAICHGVLVLARAGVLGDRRTTCLPKYMERLAYYLTFWRHGRYYRTYPDYTEDEVCSFLRDPSAQFQRGPLTLGGNETFVVEDGNYLSARWPGDAYVFANRLLEKLQ
ncbi:MAG: DJ-1/PfpI family protein [Deltaproteobacteria bacterium]|nr:DJ-1/PfpI family protein [Deltaproteobacteria bacterium]